MRRVAARTVAVPRTMRSPSWFSHTQSKTTMWPSRRFSRAVTVAVSRSPTPTLPRYSSSSDTTTLPGPGILRFSTPDTSRDAPTACAAGAVAWPASSASSRWNGSRSPEASASASTSVRVSERVKLTGLPSSISSKVTLQKSGMALPDPRGGFARHRHGLHCRAKPFVQLDGHRALRVPRVGSGADLVHQRERALALIGAGQERRQRFQGTFARKFDHQALLVQKAARLVGVETLEIRRLAQDPAHLGDVVQLDTLAGGACGAAEQQHAHDRLAIAAVVDLGECLFDRRQLARVDQRRVALRLVLLGGAEREEIPVGLEEARLAERVAHVAVVVERGAQHVGPGLLHDLPRVARVGPLPRRAHRFGGARQPPGHRIEIRPGPAARPQRVEVAQPACGGLVRRRLHQRPREELVGPFVEFRHRRYGVEHLLVLAVETLELAQVLETALAQGDAVLGLAVRAALLVDLHRVEPGGKRLDVAQHLDNLGVLLLRHFSGDEDAEMAHVAVHQSHDDLAVRLHLLGRRVEVADPA